MKKKPVVAAATGMVGLMATGLAVSLLAWPADAGSSDLAFKREEDTADVVLVNDDDDLTDDDIATDGIVTRQTHQSLRARDDDTRTRTRNTGTNTGNSGDRSRTGNRSGRDDSRSGRAKVDWTQDGPGGTKRDWSRNKTNDPSRHNTRG